MRRRTQTIHAPARGSRSSRPLKSARKSRKRPSPRLSVKKTVNPRRALPLLATHVSSPSTKGPMQGAATIPIVRPMKILPKKPAKDFDAERVSPDGRRSSQKPKRLAAKASRTTATAAKHERILQRGAHEPAGERGGDTEQRVRDGQAAHIAEAVRKNAAFPTAASGEIGHGDRNDRVNIWGEIQSHATEENPEERPDQTKAAQGWWGGIHGAGRGARLPACRWPATPGNRWGNDRLPCNQAVRPPGPPSRYGLR